MAKGKQITTKQLQKKFGFKNEQHALFCLEYVKDLNATQAGLRAGYSEESSRSMSSRLLTNANVEKCVAWLQKESLKRIEYTADDLKRSLIAVEEMSVIDIFSDNMELLPLKEWPDVWLRNISAIDISSLSRAEDEETMIEVIKKIKWPDKTKNRELLGKHIDIQAWREQHKLEINGIADRLTRAKSRKNERD